MVLQVIFKVSDKGKSDSLRKIQHLEHRCDGLTHIKRWCHYHYVFYPETDIYSGTVHRCISSGWNGLPLNITSIFLMQNLSIGHRNGENILMYCDHVLVHPMRKYHILFWSEYQ